MQKYLIKVITNMFEQSYAKHFIIPLYKIIWLSIRNVMATKVDFLITTTSLNNDKLIICVCLNKFTLWGVDGSLYFTLPSMNRLNQTEPATFAILLFWAFFMGSFFLNCKKGKKKITQFTIYKNIKYN